MDISALRQDYKQATLDEFTLAPNPFAQFEKWIGEAIKAELPEPNAMTLSTVDAEGRPDARTVLAKQFDERGIVFFTNYESKKAEQMAQNPNVALLFPWISLERQVIVLGSVEKVSTAESLKYFVTRPVASRLGAWVSPQSKVITSRSLLESKWQEMKSRFASGEVPLPSFWGGYRVIPRSFEFWQGRSSRLHDRFRYTRQSDGSWLIERLAP